MPFRLAAVLAKLLARRARQRALQISLAVESERKLRPPHLIEHAGRGAACGGARMARAHRRVGSPTPMVSSVMIFGSPRSAAMPSSIASRVSSRHIAVDHRRREIAVRIGRHDNRLHRQDRSARAADRQAPDADQRLAAIDGLPAEQGAVLGVRLDTGRNADQRRIHEHVGRRSAVEQIGPMRADAGEPRSIGDLHRNATRSVRRGRGLRRRHVRRPIIRKAAHGRVS